MRTRHLSWLMVLAATLLAPLACTDTPAPTALHPSSPVHSLAVATVPVPQVSAGGSHTCALKSNGTVICWGANDFLQGAVPSGLIAVQISAGGRHTCALRPDGTAICWGSDANGQIAGASGVTGIAQIMAGDNHTCALKVDGTMACWGDNAYGQTNVPLGLTGVVQINAHWDHTCVVMAGGAVACWGRNDYGEVTVPSSATGVVQVAASGFHSCALKSDGIIVCWGYNASGQTTVPNTVTGAAEVQTGYYHTCARLSGGTLSCWGDNTYGQTAVPPTLIGVTQVSTGGHFTCVLTTTGRVQCWGYDGLGQTDVPADLQLTEPVVGLTIDPGAYTGMYRLQADNRPESIPLGVGIRTTQVTPGRYGLFLLESAFAITVAADGTVTADDPVAITGAASRATVNTIPITVDPIDFPLQYFLHDNVSAPSTGISVFRIPPGATFALGMGADNYLVADVAHDGTVTSRNAAGATGSANRLTFNTVPIAVDPVAFASMWTLHGGPRAVGPATVPLVRNLAFAFQFGDAPKTFPSFFVDAAGTTTPQGTTGLIGGVQRITFRNVVAHVTTSVPGATWQLYGASYGPVGYIAFGDAEVVLIPDVAFYIERSDKQVTADDYFYVGDPCTITPNVFVMKGVTYTMACGPLVTVTANAGGPYTGPEGGVLSFDGSASQGTGITYDWDFGDSSVHGAGPTPAHVYVNNGSYTVRLTTTSPQGASAVATATATITNVAPTMNAFVTGASSPVSITTAVPVSATFTDPGVSDTHVAQVNWGDGAGFQPATAFGTLTEDHVHGGGSIAVSHTYPRPGVYAVQLQVADMNGGQSAPVTGGTGTGVQFSVQYAVVYDPTAGYVTGGGWITSPAGAVLANPSLVGKATFGFVARYQKGASVPDGHTQFDFHAAGITFQSTSYDWLVVAGPHAKYKGTGTINGAGNYAFLLTATDGKIAGSSAADAFRLKVWSTTTGAVVYDNQRGAADDSASGTTLGGGSITIHP